MLGIFLIVCMAVYFFIRFKEYCLVREDFVEEVELDSVGREYENCRRVEVLRVFSLMVALVGYLGCVWPFAFVEGVDVGAYIIGFVGVGILPVVLVSCVCYLSIRSGRETIRITTEAIEYTGRKSFAIEVRGIKKISYSSLWSYEIHLKEKGKKPLSVNLSGFYKRKEICSLMKQFRYHCAELSGRDKKLVHKLSPYKLDAMLTRYHVIICEIVVACGLLYGCYCCIDYDFFRKDYTAELNTLGAVQGEVENAWPSYVKAADDYVKMPEDIEDVVREGLKSDGEGLSGEQADSLRKWFDENKSSWESLKKAASIDYCKTIYENMPLVERMKGGKDSEPSRNIYHRIASLYSNVISCQSLGVLDLDILDIFEMRLSSAKHFIGGKTFMDQIAGYSMLWGSISLLEDKESYELEELERVRGLLKEYFPNGVPEFSVEGEVLLHCSFYNDMIDFKKIPVQSPLNPWFMALGSGTGMEASIRKIFADILEKARNGVEVEEDELPIIGFPIMKNSFLNLIGEGTDRLYKKSLKAASGLLAGYFLLDLEEYRLVKGEYPADVLELGRTGFDSQLPDDVDSGGKVIYLNDGGRAVLYAVGKNGTDDGGYKDGKEAETKRDDVVYWERDLKEEKVQAR